MKFITPLVTSSLIALVVFLLGLSTGYNTNKIRYIGATTYCSHTHNSKTIGTSELTFTKHPVEIFYSQGDDTGSEVKEEVNIFTATGVLINTIETTFSQTNKVFTATSGYTPLRFHAFVAKTDQGVIYSSTLMVTHPDGGSIEMSDNETIHISGSTSVQKELREAAKHILENL